MSSYTTFNANTGNTNTTANFTGLDNGKYYQFRVSAINSEGSGVVSLSDKALVSGPPNAVTSLTPTIGANSVSLSWTKPSSSGGKLITGYKIESKLYAETVSDALASVSATAGNGECVVSWVAPTNFGYSDITGYKVEYAASPYNTWSVATASVISFTYTVTGLTNGTSYKFRVSVINGVGTSSPTESSIATPQAEPPDPPTSLTVLAGDQEFTGSWTAPTNDGGAAITGYDLLYAPGPSYNSFTTVSFGNTTSYTVLSLTNGTSYKFKVSAKNSGGTGTASALSSAVTPNTFSATGGSIGYYTVSNVNYKVHTFASSATFTVTGDSKVMEFLIVAGGGGGASKHGGGGGAGGLVVGTSQTITPGNHNVVIGGGGNGVTTNSAIGTNGSDSSFNNITATGGGGGSSGAQGQGATGGSGGGSRGNRNDDGGVSNQNDYNNVTNVTGYGNDGGKGKNASNGGGGGGGGAGAQGQNGPSSQGGVGGDGIQNSFRTGSNEYYAGGGAGGGPNNYSHAGGQGGGGTGGATPESARDATPNTGGGGGAGGHYNGWKPGGDGGSGVVVIRYVV